jgi:hypothetical protein
MAELVNAVNCRDENITGLTYQKTLLPAPATKGKDYESLGKSERRTVLTFAMDPEERARSRFLPCREHGAVDKPRSCPAMPRFAGDVVNFP